jgi:DNA-binding IclR family transcriptional regulator
VAAVTEAARSLLAAGCISICTVRAFSVLAAVPEDGSESGPAELAAQVGLPVDTVARVLETLTALGLVEQPCGARRYRRTKASLADCVAELP